MDLPSTTEDRNSLIKDGILEYNLRLEKNLITNDESSTIEDEISMIDIKFISECMKLVVYQNMLEDFVSVWEVFQNDMGRKNYKDQVSARQYLISKQIENLDRLTLKLYDDYDGGGD